MSCFLHTNAVDKRGKSRHREKPWMQAHGAAFVPVNSPGKMPVCMYVQQVPWKRGRQISPAVKHLDKDIPIVINCDIHDAYKPPYPETAPKNIVNTCGADQALPSAGSSLRRAWQLTCVRD